VWVSHVVLEIDALSIPEASATSSELCHQVAVIPLSLPGHSGLKTVPLF